MAEQKTRLLRGAGRRPERQRSGDQTAYRKLAKENHPDLHPGDKACEARFKEANEAYEVLSNAEKKAKYDQFGFAGVDPNYGAGAGGYGGGFTGDFDFGDLGDIFGSFFGGGFGGGQARRNGPVRGETIRTSVSISFEEAAFGCEKEVVINRTESCSECGGTGCAKGTRRRLAPTAAAPHGAAAATDAHGCVRHHYDLSQVRRHGQDHPPALPEVPWHRRGAPPAHHQGQHPRRHRQRPDHLPAGPGQRREKTAGSPAICTSP